MHLFYYDKLMKFLEGKKTYITSVLLVIIGGLLYAGYVTQEQAEALGIIFTGGAFASLRAAKKGEQ